MASTVATGQLAALCGFERMTRRRLEALLAGRQPAHALAVASGDADPPAEVAALLRRDPTLAATWRESARRRPSDEWAERCAAGGIIALLPADPRYPAQLLDEPERPPVLFARGDPGVLDARRVGVVGTRNATQRGRQLAARFGYELAAAGVVVVSGLAKGIDGAAHRGALDVEGSKPVGIVGNGLDRPYPRHHVGLWERVAGRGALLSEWPPGTPPDAFRFPLRNRILAALVEVLVVVESRERGGSLITAREAMDRDVAILAVPGSVRSPASRGTNRLLADGATPALESSDVLVALGLDRRRAGRSRFDPRPLPRGLRARVVTFCRSEARTIEHVASHLEVDLGTAAIELARAERDGWLRESGGWFETVDEWSDLAGEGAR